MNEEVKTQPADNMRDDSAFANLPGEELSDQNLEAVAGGKGQKHDDRAAQNRLPGTPGARPGG